MSSSYLALAAMCVLGLAVRTSYELLKKSGKLDSNNKVIFSVVFVAMLAMLGSWPSMCPLDPWPLALPAGMRWLGLAAIALGAVLALGALVQLRGVENIDHLVTVGLFAKLRHPMYAGFVLWIAGWGLRHGAGVSLAVGLLAIANVLYWRSLEERALEAAYGDPYRSYRQRTWF